MTRIAVGYFLVLLAGAITLTAINSNSAVMDEVAWTVAALWLAASVVAGALANRWRAVALIATVVPAYLVTDLLWVVGILDRSEEYEPIPATLTVVLAPWVLLPGVACIALGVAARRVSHYYSSRTSAPPGAN